MTRSELAASIYRVSTLEGEFKLRSGQIAHQYFDKYRFESSPVLLAAVAHELRPLIPADTEILAGLELGGVPIATALSQVTGIPAVFVRKRAKEYGTCQLAEGAEIAGRKLLIVEDVVTTGGQIALSAADLRALDARVDRAICVIDRESGGQAALEEAGIALDALFTRSELVEATPA
jgi:orotate phosphoribosyltransferase